MLDWMESEWADEGSWAWLKGYVADVWKVDDDLWFWTVKATEAVSEWPELQDSGQNKTAGAAKNAAAKALRWAAKGAPDRNPNSGAPNEWSDEYATHAFKNGGKR